MANPLDDENGMFHVLINKEEQHSLWPIFSDVPSGWKIVFENKKRQECLDYIKENWKDIRPKSLRDTIKKVNEQ